MTEDISGRDLEMPAPRAPKIGDLAPPFTARTTMGVRALSDYQGKWLLLFSHPADFTPVCTSEFIAFQRRAADLRAKNCELLGLSADSIYAHLAWVHNIKAAFGVEIDFPIIEDLSMAVAERYGMIDERSTSTATIRSVFFIDPDGVIRAVIQYPMTVGRSIEEIVRVLDALQATQNNDLATPAGWTPGAPMLKAPPVTLDGLNSRLGNAPEKGGDWYYVETPS